jgi:hypothetical protein
MTPWDNLIDYSEYKKTDVRIEIRRYELSEKKGGKE